MKEVVFVSDEKNAIRSEFAKTHIENVTKTKMKHHLFSRDSRKSRIILLLFLPPVAIIKIGVGGRYLEHPFLLYELLLRVSSTNSSRTSQLTL